MNDLISRQALREAMYHEAFETDSDMQKWDSGCWIRYKMFENAIESAPTIDPVKHGKWKPFDLTWGRSVYACTSCGEAFEVPTEMGKPIYGYCPNCGAKMDEVSDE